MTKWECTLKSVMLKVSNKTDNRKIKRRCGQSEILKKRRTLQPGAVKCAKLSNFFLMKTSLRVTKLGQ